MADFGEVSIPAGGNVSGESNVSSSQETPQAGTPNTVEWSDDTLVKGVPGFNEPVRYGDLAKRLQADYTRKTQDAQRTKQQYETERQTWQRESQQERQRLEQLAQTLVQKSTQTPTQADPLFQKLASAKFIDGPLMSEFIQTVQDKGFAPIAEAFKQRDQITQGMYQELLELRKMVTSLHEARQSESTETKIDRWLSEGGYPKEAKNLAKEIYSAYQGDDLDSEFPNIFADRWNTLQTIMRNQDKARAEEAKRQGRRLPGRGGSGTASRPIGLKGNEKSSDVANALWDAIQMGEDT